MDGWMDGYTQCELGRVVPRLFSILREDKTKRLAHLKLP